MSTGLSYCRYADHAKTKNCKAPPKYMNNNSNSNGASVVTDHCPMNASTSKNDGAFSTMPALVILVPDSVRTTASINNVKKKSWRDDGRFKFILRHLETFEAGYYGSGARNKKIKAPKKVDILSYPTNILNCPNPLFMEKSTLEILSQIRRKEFS